MVGPDGYPLSWKHFQYGLKEIRKHHARESLRMSGAASIARSSKEDFEAWRREMKVEAGYD